MFLNSKFINRLVYIPIEYIIPNSSQPRKNFNKDELKALSESILRNGVIQPLTVRKISSCEYELIAGERRWRASVMAGLDEVPCVIMKCSDNQSAIFALLENLQRENLNMFEEAVSIRNLIVECKMTQQQIAKRLGKNQYTISNKLKLLSLNDDEQSFILKNNLSESHARAVLKLDEKKRKIALQKIADDLLSVSQTEKLICDILKEPDIKQQKNQTQRFIIKDVRIFINTFTKALNIMKSNGINAVSSKIENDEYIEYSIKIPKESVYDRRQY